jgi:serine/threonine protein kinase
MNSSNNLIGKMLGTCRLEKPIGQGGMGVVYLAQQTRPARYVAVKVLLPSALMNPEIYREFLTRFRREADVIAKLEHVNIIPIYDYGEQDGLAYLVMPYLTGGSLRDRLARFGALSLQETSSYIDQAAAALDYAHAHGVIHRDLKPGNLLLHADGRLVLADFGIARIIHDSSTTINPTLTSTGMFLGTPEYMAPEMARGEPLDQRADIYGLGILIFQMLSGQLPFIGNTPLAVMAKHLQEPAPALSQVNPTFPPAVNVVVQKAIAKKREDRFTSAGALAQSLHLAVSTGNAPAQSNVHQAPVAPTPAEPTAFPFTIPAYKTPQPTTNASIPSSAPGWAGGQPASDQQLPGYSKYPSQTPHIQQPVPVFPSRTPRSTSMARPLLLLFVGILVVIGALLIGLQIKGSLATKQPDKAVATTLVSRTQPITTPRVISGGTPTMPTTSITPTLAVTPTPSPVDQAQAMVQQYYSYINQQDYQDAYNLWGADYQSTHSYSQFASGFANTRRDDLTINSSTQLDDGTVKVVITLYATEDSTTGPVTKTFQGYYIVGIENGAWKLLRASLHQIA